MPGFDQTGPQVMGPRTGRGFGPCGFGMSWGRGRGYGRGLGRYFGWGVVQTKEEKVKEIKDYLEALKEEIEDVEKHLADVQKSA